MAQNVDWILTPYIHRKKSGRLARWARKLHRRTHWRWLVRYGYDLPYVKTAIHAGEIVSVRFEGGTAYVESADMESGSQVVSIALNAAESRQAVSVATDE